MDAGHIKATTIEACRIAANQYIRGEGKLYIRIFPNKPVTARPLETRMGKGKGEPDHWVAVIRPGTVLFELAGVSHEAARALAVLILVAADEFRWRRLAALEVSTTYQKPLFHTL